MSKEFRQTRARQVDAVHSVIAAVAAAMELAPVQRGRPSLGPRPRLRKDRGPHGTFYSVGVGNPKSLRIPGNCREQADKAMSLAKLAAEAKAVGHIVPGKIPLPVIFDFYKTTKDPKLPRQDKTQRDFVSACRALDRVLSWFGDDAVADDVGDQECEDYCDWLIQQPYRGRPESGRTLSLGTACMDMYRAKAAVFLYSARNKIAVPNGFVSPPRPSPRTHYLTRSEFARLLWTTCRGWIWDRETRTWATETFFDERTGETSVRPKVHDRFLKPGGREAYHQLGRAILVLFYTGTRSERTCKLVWGSDADRGSIDVSQGIIRRMGLSESPKRRKGKGGRMRPVGPKPARASILPSGLLDFAFRWYLRDAVEGYSSVFRKPNGEAYNSVTLLRGIKLLGEQAGLDGLIVHEFRHTTVTHCLLAGLSVDDTARFVGMSAKMVDEVYGHLGVEGTMGGAKAINKSSPFPVHSTRDQAQGLPRALMSLEKAKALKDAVLKANSKL